MNIFKSPSIAELQDKIREIFNSCDNLEIYRIFVGHGDSLIIFLEEGKVILATWFNSGWQLKEKGYVFHEKFFYNYPVYYRRDKEYQKYDDLAERYAVNWLKSIDRRAAIVELLTNCSARCPGCYMNGENSRLNKKYVFTIEGVRRYLDFLDPYSNGLVESLDILGGEPLLVWSLVQEVVLECKQRNIQPWLFTNLAHMTLQRAQWLFENQVKVTGKWNIGFPKTEEDWQRQSRLIGRNKSFAQSIWRGIQLMKQAGFDQENFSLENLIRPDNVDLVPDFFAMCFELGLKPDLELPAACDHLLSNYQSYLPSKDNMWKMLNGLKDICELYSQPVPDFIPPHVIGPCTFFSKSTYARYNGDIQPCSGNQTVVGNFLDPNCTIEKVLTHPIMKIRREIVQLDGQNKMNGICRECPDWDKCFGGCRVGPENLGDFFGSCLSCFKY